MVADHYQGGVEVCLGDEVVQRMVVQVMRAADMVQGIGLRVADVDHDGTLFTQGLGLFRGDTFEFAHGWVLTV
ncbi:hypothetical protein D3C76_1170510 [compost metagenome]